VVVDRFGDPPEDGVLHGGSIRHAFLRGLGVSGEIRRAASVVAVRDGAGGPEILVLERGERNRFLPGYVVFPGGAVDETDAELARRWFGDEREWERAAGVRELAEEVGLALTARGLVAVDGDDVLAAVHAAPPAGSQLSQVCHWVAPERVPVRFDARYFAIAAPPAVEPRADGGEAVRAWWTPPQTLFDEWQRGQRRLYWPTWYTVTRLVACADADAIERLRFVAREPDEDELGRLPRSVFWQD
jgi:8-oxo-dGTP pyrophosphatase MutT (NUDIX family)